jgi:hypothetical protein
VGLEEDAQKEYDKLSSAGSSIPSWFCKVAAIRMSWKGYKIIKGLVHLDNYCGLGKSLDMVHYWNYDPDSGKEFDLTAEQFNAHIHGPPLPEVGIWYQESRPGFYQEHRRVLEPNEIY